MRLASRRPLVLAAALTAALTCGSILPASAQDLPLPPPVTLLTRDLTDWTADRTRARVEAGVVRVAPGDGWLRFDRVLADFVLTMDVRLLSEEAKRAWSRRTRGSGVWPGPDGVGGRRQVAVPSGHAGRSARAGACDRRNAVHPEVTRDASES